ncbi:MAG TPA: hypothetical protein VMT20_30300 [Terriglobia bacterium]|nr:hypothetical protein [Terriglobia bacterium]
MDDRQLLDMVIRAKDAFGVKCSKYYGAVAVECIRRAFGEHGISTSSRDVFISKVPVEIDLIIPRAEAAPEHGIVYSARDVLVALEIKASGAYGDATHKHTGCAFQLISKQNPQTRCAYVAVAERANYRWAVSKENLGFPAYTLFFHKGSPKKLDDYESTGDWQRLMKDIGSWCSSANRKARPSRRN